MKRPLVLLWLCGALLCRGPLSGSAAAQEPPLGGIWSLDRAASQIPKEIGFNVNWVPPPESGRESGSGSSNRGRRGGGGGDGNRGSSAPFPTSRESSEDYRRVQLVTSEARNPPARLTIVDSGAAVTFTNELGQARTFHPGGGDEWIQPEGASIRVTPRRDGEKLVLVYHVEANRDVRYTFTPARNPRQLVIEVEFLEKGTAGDIAKLVYQPGLATDTAATNAPGSAPPPGGGAPGGTPASSPATGLPAEKFDQRPGAELRGLKTLGILIEDLSSQATACGLNHDAIENALTSRLSAAGFNVRKNSDDDTYVYVNVMTTNVSGSCVSRYDAFLYTQATANLSYRDQPVLVQVSLMHRGGIATTAPPTHAPTVTRGLESYIDVFVSQIREANK